MPLVTNLFAFLLAAGLVIVVPGPATLYVSHRALQSNQNAALAVLGIVTGDLVWIAAASLGIATLLAQWPLLLHLGKLVGASYLAYVAIGLLRTRCGPNANAATPMGAGGSYRQALLLTLTNPKPILFFAAFFPSFIAPSSATPLHSFALLGLLFEGLNLLYFAALVTVLVRLRHAAVQWAGRAAAVRKISACGLLVCSGLILLA